MIGRVIEFNYVVHDCNDTRALPQVAIKANKTQRRTVEATVAMREDEEVGDFI